MPEEVPKKLKTKKLENPYPFLTDNQYPTLYVKNFGKIEEAEVELAPFTLFVGDNNSGKSYLMNLIWGLKNEFSILSRNKIIFKNIREYSKESSYKNIKKYVKQLYKDYQDVPQKTSKTPITNDLLNHLIELLNILLNDNKEALIHNIFNIYDTAITIETLRITFPEDSILDTYINIEELPTRKIRDNEEEEKKGLRIKISGMPFGLPVKNSSMGIDRTISFIFDMIFGKLFGSGIFNNNLLFLPSSRTGFTLLKDDLDQNIQEEILHLDSESMAKVQSLTRPVREFYSQYSFLKEKEYKNNLSPIIKFIESELITGNLDYQKTDAPRKDILYTPTGVGKEFPMSITSGVVTELAPLVMFLKYVPWNILFMEEPEISLHPQLQQQIARVLIKLVNSKKQVIITTHSDTVIQHINNMIKLYNNSENRQKELLNNKEYFEGYESNDILNPEKIRMYQFDVNNNKTEVKKLSHSKYGFQVPTFNDFIRSMSKQIDQLLDEM